MFKKKKTLGYFLKLFSANAMAGPCACQSFCKKPLSTGKDKLARIVLRPLFTKAIAVHLSLSLW